MQKNFFTSDVLGAEQARETDLRSLTQFDASDIPSFAKIEAYDFGTPASVEIYRELMGIAKEIERCRASI